MFLSVFDIFKIGIGPSSSHTMGPMIAANRFLDVLRDHLAGGGAPPQRITCTLHGSLAFTGKGHGTDRAVILGLLGHSPDRLDPVAMALQEQAVWETGTLEGQGLPLLTFRPAEDVIFDFTEALPAHPNGLVFRAWDTDDTCVLTATYFSIGGGFVLSEAEMDPETASLRVASMGDRAAPEAYPYGFATAREMLAMGQRDGRSIAEMKRANERVDMPEEALNRRLDALWAAMGECLAAGLARRGELPGGLHVKRRAAVIRDQLAAEAQRNLVLPHVANDWLAVYAMAVNEENAAGGRVVTAPTNGAAGVIPAVLYYLIHHCPAVPENAHRDFLLTAAAIGGLIKHNASISGAEVGCQGEVGSAAAMAAAGFCALQGGSNEQIENAAEIALEHHLGMTCDPVAGLVQVPCIERNGLGAIKAVSAASLALRGDGSHFMPLDHCIQAMRETGQEMSSKYKETSTGGLAVNMPEC